MTNISARNCELILEKMIATIQKAKVRYMLTAMTHFKSLGNLLTLELNPQTNKSSFYVLHLSFRIQS